MASKNDIKIVTFPPHTSHRLQPLDVSVFGPFKTFYSQGLDAWHINNNGKTFSIYNVAVIVGSAFPRAFSTTNICSGFKNTGIYPLNIGIFDEDMFLPSSVTDRPMLDTENTAVAGSSSELHNVVTAAEDIAIAGPSSRSDSFKSPEQSDLVTFISPQEVSKSNNPTEKKKSLWNH